MQGLPEPIELTFPLGSDPDRLMVYLTGHHNLINPFCMALLTYLILAVFFFLVRRRISIVPGKLQSLLEVSVDFVRNFATNTIGPRGEKYIFLFYPLFMFILIGNLLGLVPGMMSPTVNVNINFAMAFIVFISYYIIGIRLKGWKGYFKHFLPPSGLPTPVAIFLTILLPLIHAIGELVRPISLTIRLFCNIMAKELILGVFGVLVIHFFLMPSLMMKFISSGMFILRFLIIVLGVLVSLLQACIFTALAVIYVAGAVEVHEEGH